MPREAEGVEAGGAHEAGRGEMRKAWAVWGLEEAAERREASGRQMEAGLAIGKAEGREASGRQREAGRAIGKAERREGERSDRGGERRGEGKEGEGARGQARGQGQAEAIGAGRGRRQEAGSYVRTQAGGQAASKSFSRRGDQPAAARQWGGA